MQFHLLKNGLIGLALYRKATTTRLRYVVTNPDGTTTKKTALANKDVILAGSALGSAKLLLLSGIGPQSQLNKWGISPVVLNANVGQNIRNHYAFVMTFEAPNASFPNLQNFPSAMMQYGLTGNGIFASSVEVDSILVQLKTLPNLVDPDIYFFLNWQTADDFTKTVSVLFITATPEYKNGTVTLSSANPMDELNYTKNSAISANDVASLVRAIEIVRGIFATPAAKEIFGAETFPGAQYNTTQLNEIVSGGFFLAYHYYGSAKMGNSGDLLRVVDNHLRVVGVNKLRVIDSSIIPNPVSAYLQCCVVGIAEKGANITISDWA